jgi:hypothetical protein
MKTVAKSFLLITALAACLAASADTIVLTDGDRLSGSLIEISDEIAVFRTELAGQIILPLVRIASVTTSRDVQVVFKDGGRGVGRLVATGGEMHFVPAGDGKPYAVTMNMLVSVAPKRANDTTASEPDATEAVSSSVSSGAQMTFGNDDFVSLYSRLRLEAERDRYTWAADALFATDEGADEIGSARMAAIWRWLPETRLQPMLELALEREADQLLDLRASLAVGGYRSLWEGERHDVSGMLGVALESERWDGDDLNSKDAFPDSGWNGAQASLYYRAVDRQREETDLRLKLNLRHVLHAFDRVTWEEQLTLAPSLTDPESWRGAYATTVFYPLADRLRLNLSLRVDYDNDPAFRYLEEWSTTVGAGIEWSF